MFFDFFCFVYFMFFFFTSLNAAGVGMCNATRSTHIGKPPTFLLIKTSSLPTSSKRWPLDLSKYAVCALSLKLLSIKT